MCCTIWEYSVCVCRYIGSVKKFIQVSPKMVQKNLKELFGQPNKYTLFKSHKNSRTEVHVVSSVYK